MSRTTRKHVPPEKLKHLRQPQTKIAELSKSRKQRRANERSKLRREYL